MENKDSTSWTYVKITNSEECSLIKLQKCLDKGKGQIKEMGIKYFHFIDDTWGADKDFAHDFCESLLATFPDAKWSCETHVRCIDEETVKHMKKAGGRFIQSGVDAGNYEILRSQQFGIYS